MIVSVRRGNEQLLSSILVATMLGGLLAAQIRQIGAMKAIGARTSQILTLYLSLAAGIAMVATALALAPGLLLGRVLAGQAATCPTSTFRVPPARRGFTQSCSTPASAYRCSSRCYRSCVAAGSPSGRLSTTTASIPLQWPVPGSTARSPGYADPAAPNCWHCATCSAAAAGSPSASDSSRWPERRPPLCGRMGAVVPPDPWAARRGVGHPASGPVGVWSARRSTVTGSTSPATRSPSSTAPYGTPLDRASTGNPVANVDDWLVATVMLRF